MHTAVSSVTNEPYCIGDRAGSDAMANARCANTRTRLTTINLYSGGKYALFRAKFGC